MSRNKKKGCVEYTIRPVKYLCPRLTIGLKSKMRQSYSDVVKCLILNSSTHLEVSNGIEVQKVLQIHLKTNAAGRVRQRIVPRRHRITLPPRPCYIMRLSWHLNP